MATKVNLPKKIKSINNRIYFIYVAVLLFILFLFSRLFYLQVYISSDLKEKAGKQQKRPISLSSKRGLITDRNGNKLAIDTKSVSLYAYPKEYNLKKFKISDMAKQISEVIDEDIEKVSEKLYSKGFIWLKRQMPIEMIDKVKTLRKMPGINFVYESKRVYPKQELAASLLGFTGIDNQGLTGIEHSFNDVLTGDEDPDNIFLDGLGREILRKEYDEPSTTSTSKSNKVILTLDENIQYFTERELKKGVESYKAERGLAITMDLENGDLLSLATYPTFNPNDYSKTDWSVIKNWAVTDVYEPGSTMKIFSIAAALEKKKTRIEEQLACPGAIKVGKWIVHDHGMSSKQVRMLTPFDIIKTSSNVGTSIITRRMSPEEHRGILIKFGFGEPTDSKLAGEVKGMLPELPWRESRQSTISFGQGIAVTPLQIVTAMSAIARDGVRIEPRIIKKIVDFDDNLIKEYESKEVRTLSKDVAKKMVDLMVGVVEEKGGTGVATKIPGYRIGGKTGTADKVENGRYRGNVMSSFIGFYPASKPRILSFVLFDSPKTAHYASMTAVPVFREIADNVLKYLKIPPTVPEELIDKDKKK